MTTTLITESIAARNFVDFYSESGELLLACDLDRPHFLLANAVGGWVNRGILETVAERAGLVADRDSLGQMMLSWGESVRETEQVAETVFDRTGTVHLRGGKLIAPHHVSYADQAAERSRTVRYVHRADYGR